MAYLKKLMNTLGQLDPREIEVVYRILKDTRERKETVYVMGNGGSALTAMHFACDLGRSVGMAVIPLVGNIGVLTAVANDISYDAIFDEQLAYHLRPGNVVVGISGSGNSINVLNGIKFAKNRGNVTIGFTGYDGGVLRRMVDASINANVNDMQISEDIHLIIVHLLMRRFQEDYI